LAEEVSLKELSELAESRSKIYGFLSQIYMKAPTLDLIQRIYSTKFEELLTSLKGFNGLSSELSKGVEIIKHFIKNTKEIESEEIRRKLSIEYTRLLRGVKRFYGPPPPYESVYLGEGLVMGDITVTIQRIYDEAGLMIHDEQKGEMPDYIGLELDYMKHLCAEEAKSWIRNDIEKRTVLKEKQSEFLNEHLGKWAPSFCDNALKYVQIDFYKGILKLTKGFILFEVESRL
jgi:anaerobic sulfite reductase subunit A